MITIALPLAAQTESAIFAPFVSRLTAQVEDYQIHLSWTDSQNIRGSVYLFLSTTPFLGPSPVLGDIHAVIPYGIESYSDDIGTDDIYYYFAVASDMNDRRFNFPIPDTNTIAVPLWMETDPGTQPGFSAPGHYWQAPIHMLPRAFARDLEAFQYSGDNHALSSIIRNNFAARDWESAKNELFLFLSMPRSQDTRDRARFYLGQCLYFLHQPKEGLFEFLTIIDRFPNEISGWIQASYNMINYYSY